ncbi:unnamed protein product [Ixodes hexagonus]
MDMYGRFKNEIGPFKRFSNQKKMYAAIAHELKTIVNAIKTAEQCEARVRTVMKRKKKAIDNNRTSGATRRPVPFEQELEHIRSVDDSVQPQIIWNIEEVWRKVPVEKARENLPAQASPDEGATSPSQSLEHGSAASSSANRSAASSSATRSAASLSANGSAASTSGNRSAERERRPRSLQPSRARMAELAQFFQKMDEMNAKREEREQRREEQRERRHRELVQLNN